MTSDSVATRIDDHVLPAASYLTGPDVAAILTPAVQMGGGELRSARPVHVQYRPGSDLVVQFTCGVAWAGGDEVRETLVASTTVYGEPLGTVPVEADAPDGSTLRVGVWRWPFDPALPALDDVVVPQRVVEVMGGIVVGPPELTVVAYRPTERAVVRVRDRRGDFYVKAVRPAATASFVERHQRLGAAGLPVPPVLAADHDAGWVAMQALVGDTFRIRVKEGWQPWPSADDLLDLAGRLATVELDGAVPVRSRISDAIAHARVLATVAPELDDRLAALVEAFELAEPRAVARRGPTIHGDLHEGQLVLDGREGAPIIGGVLDIDDVGPGDPIDDLGTLLGHLTFRASGLGAAGDALAGYVDELANAFGRSVDPGELRTVQAAVLIGLATGPFRVQHPQWRESLEQQVVTAEALLAAR